MKFWLILILLLMPFVQGDAADDQTELIFADGSRLVCKVTSVTATEATLMTDFAVLRIPLEKLTAESRAKLTAGKTPDNAALLRRISELEARVAQLQQENETLRRQSLATTPTPAPTYRPANSFAPSSPPASTQVQTSGESYTISSTGKRHNSRCRYFGGAPCGPNQGIACKICGG